MKRPEYRVSAIGLLMLVTCAACSSGNDEVLGVTTNWLGPLHQYERMSGADRFGVFLRKNGPKPAPVRQLIIAPAEITISPRSDLDALDPAGYEKIRAAFADALSAHIAKRFPASADNGEPVADAYVLRAALTNLTVKRNTRKTGPVDLDELEFTFDGTTVEASLAERSTNARRAVIVQKAGGGKIRWNAMGKLFDAVAMAVAEKIAEARNGIDTKASQPEIPAAKAAEKAPEANK